MTFRETTFSVGLSLLIPIFLFLILELLLQLFWKNPYLEKPLDTSARLHAKNMTIEVSTEGFYPHDDPIFFRTLTDRSIFSGILADGGDFVALGGSTTESSLVPEGQRWPDLLNPPAMNYGVSGNYLIDSYYNLIYLHDHMNPPPNTATIMHAVNDLEFFISQGSEKFEISNWSHSLENPLVTFDSTNRNFIGQISISSSAVMSLITYVRNNTGARRIIAPYLAQKKSRDMISILEDEPFQDLKHDLVETFLPKRLTVLEQILEASRNLKVKLIMLTQPHAYTDTYTPPVQDLRITPVWRGDRLSILQTAELMELVNNQTKIFAKGNGIRVIDLAKCLKAQKTGPLFFDSVHYSFEGSRKVADCINRDIREN